MGQRRWWTPVPHACLDTHGERLMPLITVVITIIVIGVLLWLAETYLPMSPPIKMLLRVVVVIALVIWLLNIAGLLGGLQTVPFPHR